MSRDSTVLLLIVYVIPAPVDTLSLAFLHYPFVPLLFDIVEPLFGLETPSARLTKWALFFYMAEYASRLVLLYKIISPKTDSIFWMTLALVSCCGSSQLSLSPTPISIPCNLPNPIISYIG